MYITIYEEFDQLCEKMRKMGYILQPSDSTNVTFVLTPPEENICV